MKNVGGLVSYHKENTDKAGKLCSVGVFRYISLS